MLRPMDELPHGRWVQAIADKDIRGFEAYGTDGPVGEIDDLVVDEETGRIRYLTVAVRRGRKSRTVWLPKSAVRRVDHAAERVYLAVTGRQIENAPPVPKGGVTPTFERALHDHFGAEYYW